VYQQHHVFDKDAMNRAGRTYDALRDSKRLPFASSSGST
jgi:hypothetical protein